MKKVFSIFAVMLIMLAMAAPAFAATGPTLSLKSGDHQYSVYQVFTGDVAEGKLSNVKYGKNAKLPGGKNIGDDVAQETLKAVAAISELTTEAKKAKAIADDYAVLSGKAFAVLDASNPVENIPTGYYLIRDMGKDGEGFDGSEEASAIYAVNILGADLAFEPKTVTATTLDKVITDDGTELGKGIEAAPGDTVYFKVSVTVTDKLADYDTYKVIISDTLTGLTYTPDSAAITIGKNDVTGKFAKTNGKLEWTCADIKADGVDAEAGDVIVLTYAATVNSGVDSATNDAYCKFSNNPHGDTLGETTHSLVHVYNFKLSVNKVDDKGQALTGASFKLSKSADGQTYSTVKEINGAALSTFEWSGLTDGIYKLEETGVPTGYNKVEPINFTITAKFDDVTGEVTYESSNELFTPNGTVISADIVNIPGSVLPTTGGVGTTIFYIVGGILVLGAVVVLVSRRKVAEA